MGVKKVATAHDSLKVVGCEAEVTPTAARAGPPRVSRRLLTAEQKAIAVLQSVAHRDPTLLDSLAAAVQQGASQVIELERKYTKSLSVKEAQSFQKTAVQSERRRPEDLGLSTAAFTPFAVEGSTSINRFRPSRKMFASANAQSKPTPEASPPKLGRWAHTAHLQEAPYDTFYLNPYPAPPSCGAAEKKTRCTRQRSDVLSTQANLDEEVERRAARRREAITEKKPDFLFGDVPPPQPKRRLIVHDSPPVPQRLGKALHAARHSPTCLW
jgi:hypothetical protein